MLQWIAKSFSRSRDVVVRRQEESEEDFSLFEITQSTNADQKRSTIRSFKREENDEKTWNK